IIHFNWKDMEVKQEVLIFGEIFHATKQLEIMKDSYEFKMFDSTRKDFLVEATTKYENVVAILLALGAEQIVGKFDAEVLDALSPAVNVIMVIGDSSNLVDIKAATDNGVFVADTSNKLQMNDDEKEAAALDNLEFALITGVPKDPVNKIEEVAEMAAEKTIEYIKNNEKIEGLDITDIHINY
ncbi:5538_t:CDS:2, partial [Acaulospora morrowiae]